MLRLQMQFYFILALLNLALIPKALGASCDLLQSHQTKRMRLIEEVRRSREPRVVTIPAFHRNRSDPLYSEVAEQAHTTLKKREDGSTVVNVLYTQSLEYQSPLAHVLRNRGQRYGNRPADEIHIRDWTVREHRPRVDRGNRGLKDLRRKKVYPKRYLSDQTLQNMAKLGGRYLDIATGGGKFPLDLRERGIDMHGLDPIVSPQFQDPDNPLSAFFVQAPAHRTGLRAKLFSGITAHFSPFYRFAQETRLMRLMLKELERLLVPGGFILIGPTHREILEVAFRSTSLRVFETSIVPKALKKRRTVNIVKGNNLRFIALEKRTKKDEPSILEQTLSDQN